MDKNNTQEEMSPKAQDKKEKAEKKAVGKLFGIQLSAPENMKNPMRIFLLLVLGNFLLLFLIGRALGLF
tara:strand:+ start:181 stop:387 length:207 start_codon:yes stop_codon:yes gene_type:complete